MKLKIALFILLLSIVACNNDTKSNKAINANPSETKQVEKFKYWNWITVGNKKSDSAFAAHFNKLKSYGIDAVLINTGADPKLLKRVAPIAKKAGLEVHAWMFTTNRPGDSVAQQHPEWYMVSRSGKSCFVKEDRPYVGYYQWLSPSHPDARKHILSLVEGLAEVEGVTSVHLDYIRYPDVYLPIGLLPKYNLKQEEELPDYDFDYSDASVNKFIALHHKDPREMENPAIDIEWKNFRLNEIKSLVSEAYNIVHKHNKKLKLANNEIEEKNRQIAKQKELFENLHNKSADGVLL